MTNKVYKQIISRLREMRLPVMADQLVTLIESNEIFSMSSEDILNQLTEEEFYSRKNNTIDRLKKKANLSQRQASVIDIDYQPTRKINRSLITQLETNEYIQKQRDIIILGACGTGKSYIANALGNLACESFHSVIYVRMFELISEIESYKLNGQISKILQKYSKVDVLIIDDFLLHAISSKEVVELFKIIELRHRRKSTIVCSQIEPKEWHQKLGSDELADSILDRIVPGAYKLVLFGDSLRQ